MKKIPFLLLVKVVHHDFENIYAEFELDSVKQFFGIKFERFATFYILHKYTSAFGYYEGETTDMAERKYS